MARNPELERTIVGDPFDPQGYLVYADWLQQNDDPRGRLIALQAALEEQGAYRVNDHFVSTVERGRPLEEVDELRPLLDEERTVFNRHRDRWIDPVAEHADSVRLRWSHGFIFSADIGLGPRGNPEAACRALLRCQSGRFVPELTLWRRSALLLKLLLQWERPEALRRLFLADYRTTETRSQMARLCEVFPRLQALQLRSAVLEIPEAFDLPALTVLGIQAEGMSIESVDHLLSPEYSELKSLTLAVGARTEPLDACLDRLVAGRFPRLERLELRHASQIDSWLRRLPDLAILPQLRVVNVAGRAREETVLELGTRADAFAHLRDFDLDLQSVGGSYGPHARNVLVRLNHDMRYGEW